MTAQLLPALLDASPAKSGIGALLSKTMGSKEGDASFADLLGQQVDTVDPQLLEALQALGVDPQARKELMAQLKDLGVDPSQLNTLMQQLKNTNEPAQTLTALRQSLQAEASAGRLSQAQVQMQAQTQLDAPALTTKSPKDAAEFINSTLFIASESKAMRADVEPRFQVAKDNKNGANLRFDLNPELLNTSKKATVEASSATAFQTVLAAAAEGGKVSASSSSPFSVELAALNPATGQAATAPTLHSAAFNPTYSAHIATPVNQTAQWGTDFGRVMVQLSQQAGQNSTAGLQTAEIRLDPPELGPLRIVLSVNDSVANAMIFAAHAHTRLTVEQSIPQLQQQLAQAGLSLGEANVSDQNFFAQSEQQADKNQTKGNTSFQIDGIGHNGETDSLLGANTSSKPAAPNAIIDTFA